MVSGDAAIAAGGCEEPCRPRAQPTWVRYCPPTRNALLNKNCDAKPSRAIQDPATAAAVILPPVCAGVGAVGRADRSFAWPRHPRLSLRGQVQLDRLAPECGHDPHGHGASRCPELGCSQAVRLGLCAL